MSSELDRLVREARDGLPTPDEFATQRARRHALATLRRNRTRTRMLVLVAAMLVCAVALGVTAGSLNPPSVTAAREPSALGFVPEPGWFALQSPPPAVEGQQMVAVAANVPFAADDVQNGLVEPSGVPYSTLLELPPDGIMIVSTMTPQVDRNAVPVVVRSNYPDVELPLQLRDGIQYAPWGSQVRPDQPLAQYHLGASLVGYNVDVTVYFGTARPSTKLLREAQRQLDSLVTRPERARPAARPAATEALPGAAATAVVDRTYSCQTVLLGGIYELKARAHSGLPKGAEWTKLPYAVVSSGGRSDTPTGLVNAPSNSLAWITAGTPTSSTTVDTEGEVFSVLAGGTIGVNKELCRPATARVALTSAGLRGGAAPREAIRLECAAPRRVFVRFRATVRGTESLRERARTFLATNTPATNAQLAVRTPAGKLLAYATAAAGGKASLFTARSCLPD